MSAPVTPEEPAPMPLPGEDREVLERRVARRLAEAPRCGPAASRCALTLLEALLLAHDLHLLGLLAHPPSLRWRPEDAARALAAWRVHIVSGPVDSKSGS